MKGISAFIGFVFAVALGVVALTIVLTVVNPLLDRAKDTGLVNEILQNMQLLDTVIKTVASESRGSARTIAIQIPEGALKINTTMEWLVFEYSPTSNFKLDGTGGDVKIEHRPIFLEYFNQYTDGSNASSNWNTINGSWSVSSERFLGTGGIAYHNIGTKSDFSLAATIAQSNNPYGQVYVIPNDPRNLIIYLPFDGNINTTQTTAHDYSAYKNNGTLINATSANCGTNNACPLWITGKFGNATSFDGVGDLINITGVNHTNSTSFSVSFWLNPSTLRTQGVIAKTTIPTSQRWRIFMADTTGKLEFDATGDIGNVQTTTSLSTGTWYFITATYDGSTARMFVNSIFEASASASSMFNNNTNHIEIAPSETNRLNGSIDEVMVFNKNLTGTEIGFLYESSIKKVMTGEIPVINKNENITIVLASPGTSHFDNVKIKDEVGEQKIEFVLAYSGIDMVNQTRFGPGSYNIVVKNYGVNSTNNKKLIGIEE